MEKNRSEAFSDGVIAIIITIMVLEIKVPQGATLSALYEVAPNLLYYVLSFVYVGIYWNNHHHMLHTVMRVNGAILWANTHLLFWLSLIPFATVWLGQNHYAKIPTAIYGVSLLMSAVAYFILQTVIIRAQGPNSILAKAVGRDIKGKISPLLYLVAIFLACVNPWIAIAIYIFVALMWLVPDRRIEKLID